MRDRSTYLHRKHRENIFNFKLKMIVQLIVFLFLLFKTLRKRKKLRKSGAVDLLFAIPLRGVSFC